MEIREIKIFNLIITDENNVYEDRVPPFTGEMGHHSPNLGTSSGISRQQLINR